MDPQPNSLWRHHSGRMYRVLFIANLPDNPDYPEMVIYASETTGQRWAGPLSDWHRRMTLVEE